jgi:hypothetical protein
VDGRTKGTVLVITSNNKANKNAVCFKVGSYRDYFPYLWNRGLLFPWALTFDPEEVRAYVLIKVVRNDIIFLNMHRNYKL